MTNLQFKTISECRICRNPNLTLIVDLGIQHLSGIFPLNQSEDSNIAPLALVKCDDTNGCGHVQLSYSCDPAIMYGDNYGYRSGLNSSMVKHLKEKKEFLTKLISLNSGDIVIDIAGNDGTFLSFFDSSLNLLSIDPTSAKFGSYYPKKIQRFCTKVDYYFFDVL